MGDGGGDAWLRRFEGEPGPLYMRLLAALERAIGEGELQPGDQLPSQRAAAQRLGVDFTTVTRAYALARARGLIEGAVGRGTFVKGRSEDEAGLIDLSMNLPPQPLGVPLARRLEETTRAILSRTDVATLMAYHPGPGSMAQRRAGAAWMAPCLGEVSVDRVLACSGAQTALAALLTLLAPPGGTIVCEALTYPGLLSVARHLGVRVVGCEVDGEGLAPDALARLCAEAAPAAIYCVPTMQNPAAVTMGIERRRRIVEIAAAAGAPIIEDDAYGRLPSTPSPALASLGVGTVFHLSTLSKCLTPGLRVAFVAAPDAAWADRLAGALRAVSMMASPLTAAVATAWIREGVADEVLSGLRAEARARRALAREILPQARGDDEAIHVWLPLPERWDPARLRDLARRRGLALVGAEAFAAGVSPNGERIALGAPAKRQELAQALTAVAAILAEGPGAADVVV